MKIIEKIREQQAEGKTVVSFEFFPPKTASGVGNLLNRVRGMAMQLQPSFVTLTWRSAFKDESQWLNIGTKIQNECGIDVLMHLTCHLPVSDLKRILVNARDAGIRNILALRGDPPQSSTAKWRPAPGGLRNAVELVRLIREEHGDFFCVAVAGYPEVHTDTWNSTHLPPSEQAKALDLKRLKEKVDAGADFIVTQLFYDVDLFLDFRMRCRGIGIEVPILPGYMVPQTYQGFRKFTQWCRTRVPADLATALEDTKHDDEGVKKAGIQHAIEVGKRLKREGVTSLHFYTMNLSIAVTRVLEGLGLVPKGAARSRPWTDGPHRTREEVRPIFWIHRVDSYLARTAAWDEYPNGRWGDSRSPAYGELTDYYLASKQKTTMVDLREQWGTPTCVQDISNVFVAFIENRVSMLPWMHSPLSGESRQIVANLRWLNRNGFLTINSQPRVNAAPSDHPDFGWGGAGGYVFQKAYVEFFVSPALFTRLLDAFGRHPELTYHAIDRAGHEHSNVKEGSVNAVTWGAFPGREIIQPTVVDPASFRVWKDEAYKLWLSEWQALYDKDTPEDKPARQVLQEVHDTYVLVNIVDNSYAEPDADVFTVFREVIVDMMDTDALRARLLKLERDRAALFERVTHLEASRVSLRNSHKHVTKRLQDVEADNALLRTRVAELESRAITTVTGVGRAAGVPTTPPLGPMSSFTSVPAVGAMGSGGSGGSGGRGGGRGGGGGAAHGLGSTARRL